MTKAKIAISLPQDQLDRAKRAVKAGRAESVSGYISAILAKHEKKESLQSLIDDLIAQHGEPSAEDRKWAKRMLGPRPRRASSSTPAR